MRRIVENEKVPYRRFNGSNNAYRQIVNGDGAMSEQNAAKGVKTHRKNTLTKRKDQPAIGPMTTRKSGQ